MSEQFEDYHTIHVHGIGVVNPIRASWIAPEGWELIRELGVWKPPIPLKLDKYNILKNEERT